jgi:hypothetical protein
MSQHLNPKHYRILTPKEEEIRKLTGTFVVLKSYSGKVIHEGTLYATTNDSRFLVGEDKAEFFLWELFSWGNGVLTLSRK